RIKHQLTLLDRFMIVTSLDWDRSIVPAGFLCSTFIDAAKHENFDVLSTSFLEALNKGSRVEGNAFSPVQRHFEEGC
ncbi:MAG: hypothetical protein ABIN58_10235, partial [candidate division WOR-3 bacterium]